MIRTSAVAEDRLWGWWFWGCLGGGFFANGVVDVQAYIAVRGGVWAILGRYLDRVGRLVHNGGWKGIGMACERVYIAMGSNLGARASILHDAVGQLTRCEGVRVLQASSLMETQPTGVAAGSPAQGDYLNGVVEIEATLEPEALLGILQRIETNLGRDRAAEGKNGARTCDLDILLFGDRQVDTPRLVVPHPRMVERDFVLRPLVEIAPAARNPVTGQTAREMLTAWEIAQ